MRRGDVKASRAAWHLRCSYHEASRPRGFRSQGSNHMTSRIRAAPAWRFESSDPLPDQRAIPRSPSRATGVLVGRARELARLARGLADVPVALILGLPGVGKSALASAHAATWAGPAIVLPLAAGASISHIAEAIHRRLRAA